MTETETGWSSISRNSTNGRMLFRRVAPIRWALKILDPIAPRQVGRLGFALFRVTQRYAVPGRERAWIDAAEPLEFALDGRSVSGLSWGTGPTVLLMHGWGGRGSQMGALAVSVAEAGFRAVALDAPGHGRSEGRLSSLIAFTNTVRLASEEIGPLHAVIAHSFGAAGTGWALQGGLRSERLVFVAAPGDLDGYLDGFRELFGLSQKSLGFMIEHLESRFGVRWQETRHSTTIAADQTPMLVVHDEGDDETPYAGGLSIARAWPNSRLLTTTGLGHRRILRDPEVVAEVTAFVRGRRATAVEPPEGRTATPVAVAAPDARA